MPRSAAASTAPDILGVGPVGVSVTGLGSAWLPILALALGPLEASGRPVAVRLRDESWSSGDGAPSGKEVGSGLAVRSEPDGLVVDDRLHGVRAHLVDDAVGLASQTGRPAPCGRVLPFCLAPPLLDAGVALVHAAVVAAGERAVLVAGPTGAGKSTVVAAARAAGLRVLGDDLAAVWDDGGWRVHALARPVRVAPDLAPGAPPVPDDPRGRVSPEGWVLGGIAEVAGVVRVGHGGPGAVTTADAVAVARTTIAASFATVLPRCVAPSLAVARGLAALSGWDLALDADPSVRLAAAGRDLRSLLT